MSFTDYRLVRAKSAVVLPRSSSLERSPSRLLVTRSRSLNDLSGYNRWSDRYKPNTVVYQHTPYPYRWRHDWYDDYWYDRHYYFSPLYNSYISPYKRYYYYSDLLSNPYYWSPYSNYWTRYNGNWYDYDSPYSYHRYWDPSYSRYVGETYYPYRSYLLDSLSTSLDRGLSMYKAGLVPYRTLETYWLTPEYWNRRFKDWQELYSPAKDFYVPTTYDRKTRSYLASWTK
ncbi:unnamed protein product [Cylicocyclus nassatus]|uniref:Uncharacterized protein n=1 Tax=Cylicocyclus nassatus TaxID=53992 RepID=A0AA36DKE8_CYLNA|nr:unnamed protein product [Cylicocyclus nassatus]